MKTFLDESFHLVPRPLYKRKPLPKNQKAVNPVPQCDLVGSNCCVASSGNIQKVSVTWKGFLRVGILAESKEVTTPGSQA